MEVCKLAEGVFHLQGGSNIGLLLREGQGLLVDTGLDKDTAQRALRVAADAGATLLGAVLTHAHADHFGGAAFLQQRLGLTLYAPALEAALMENPLVEPLYLFGGAAPIAELRRKFTLAPPCRIDRIVEPGTLQVGPFALEVLALPGHAPNQIGVAAGEVLFCADAAFPLETLDKHKITFCVDMDETLATLERLPTLPYARFAPGHGPAYAAGDDIAAVCAANRARLTEVRDEVYAALVQPQETAALLRHVAAHWALQLTTATAYFLTQTTVLSALASLERAGQVRVTVEENHLLWQRNQASERTG